MLLRQFSSPLIYALRRSAAVAFALGDVPDGGVVLLNAVIGFVQESRARQALDALARMVPVEATVLRDGVACRVPAEELVPGDVVELAAGDRVPADVRLAETHLLEVDESALTGESVPVRKSTEPLANSVPLADRVNSAYSGTLVTRGSGSALVTATGNVTQLGGIQRMVADADAVMTPLTRKLSKFSRQLSVAIVIGRWPPVPARRRHDAGDAGGGDVHRGRRARGRGDPGGPARRVTIVLAIGVVRMSRLGAIVRQPARGGDARRHDGDLHGQDRHADPKPDDGDRAGRGGSGGAARGDGSGCRPGSARMLVAGVLCNDAQLSLVDGEYAGEGDPTETLSSSRP